MTTDRPYRGAPAGRRGRARLREGAGTQFDPRVVEAFLHLLGSSELGHEVDP